MFNFFLRCLNIILSIFFQEVTPPDPAPGDPPPGSRCFWIEETSGNKFALNGVQKLPATVFFSWSLTHHNSNEHT